MTLGIYPPARCACGAIADPMAGQCEACFTRDYTMVDQRELDRLRYKNAELRRALKASVAANAMYEVLEEEYRNLLQAGRNWVASVDVDGPCGGCGECSTCELVATIGEIPRTNDRGKS